MFYSPCIQLCTLTWLFRVSTVGKKVQMCARAYVMSNGFLGLQDVQLEKATCSFKTSMLSPSAHCIKNVHKYCKVETRC